MRNILLIVSHLYSGENQLTEILNEHPRIEIRNLYLSYSHPLVVEHLVSQRHKLNNAAAIYGDRILSNKDFSCKAFYNFSKFIYVVGSPKSSLNEIAALENFNELSALRYYQFRLRRIYEMCRNTPGAVYLTWSDLQYTDSLQIVENYLQLKVPLKHKTFSKNTFENVSLKVMEEAEDSYERHLYQIKQLNLTRYQSQPAAI